VRPSASASASASVCCCAAAVGTAAAVVVGLHIVCLLLFCCCVHAHCSLLAEHAASLRCSLLQGTAVLAAVLLRSASLLSRCYLLRCCVVALPFCDYAATALRCCVNRHGRVAVLLLELRHPRHGSACMLVAAVQVALAPAAPWRGSEHEPVERFGSDGDSVVVARGAATAYETAGIVSRAHGPRGSAHPGLPSTATGRWPPHASRRAGPKGHRHRTFPHCGTLVRSRHTAGASGSSLALLLRGCGRISPASGQTTSASGPGRCPVSGQWANHFDNFSFGLRPVCIHSAAT
jgi:hypothetical protein